MTTVAIEQKPDEQPYVPPRSEWAEKEAALDKEFEEQAKARQENVVAPTETEEAEEETTTETEASLEEAAEESVSEDLPLEDLSQEELIKRLNATAGEVSRAVERAEAAEKQYQDTKKKMTEATMSAAEIRRQNELLQAVIVKKEELAKEREGATETADELDFLGDLSALEPLEEDYPGITKALTPLLKQRDDLLRAQHDTIQQLNAEVVGTKQRTETLGNSVGEEAHYSEIRRSVPDYEQILADDAFAGWVESHPYRGHVLGTLDHGTAKELINVFANFKKDSNWGSSEQTQTTTANRQTTAKSQTDQTKLEKAKKEVTPPSTTHRQNLNVNRKAPLFTRKQIKDMSMDEFAKREKEIDKAIAEGRVV